MARATRHYIPGQIWHLTHRCHKRDYLLGLVKDKLGILAKGRRVLENDGALQLREEQGTWNAFFAAKKDDIGPLNAYFWGIYS